MHMQAYLLLPITQPVLLFFTLPPGYQYIKDNMTFVYCPIMGKPIPNRDFLVSRLFPLILALITALLLFFPENNLPRIGIHP